MVVPSLPPIDASSLGSGICSPRVLLEGGEEEDPLLSTGKSPRSSSTGRSRSIWEDEYVELLDCGGWRCLFCRKTFKRRHATRALCHFLKIRGMHIAICNASVPYHKTLEYRSLRKASIDLTIANERAHQDMEDHLAGRQLDSTRRLLESKNKGPEVVVLEDFGLTVTPRDKKRRHSAQATVDVAIGNQRQSLLASANNAHLQMAIADMVHCDGLPFAQVGRIRFRKVLKLAKTASSSFKCPSRNQVSGVLLDKNFDSCWDDNRNLLLASAHIFGLYWLGDGATIGRAPMTNILGGNGMCAPIVVAIIDCTNHMVSGGKKDAVYIASLFKENMELLFKGRELELDLLKETTDLFFFDGASNVQKAGRCLVAYYPRAHVLHGVEHVIALFFKDLASHSIVKVRGGCNVFYFLHNDSPSFCFSPIYVIQRMILRECRLYNVYGSGASHGIYALFQAHAALHNDGKYFGLLRGCSTRMASWFLAMQRSLRQRSALTSLVHDPKYAVLDIVKSEEKVRLATIDVKSDQHWKAKYKLVKIVEPALVALRCADSNKASMDKIYFLTDQMSKNLVRFEDELNDEELFPPLEDGDAGLDCVEMEEDMVFGQTGDGREGDVMAAPVPGDDDVLGDDE